MSIRSSALKVTVLLAMTPLALAAPPARPLAPAPSMKNAGGTSIPRVATGIATDIVLTITTPGTIFYGEDMAGYAVVSSSDGSTLTGTVTFYDGTVNICTIPVTQTTSCPASAGSGFSAGTHLLMAIYSGDGTHQGSTSNTEPVIVLPDVTSVSLASSANPAAYGQSVVFTATAQGSHATPAGQVSLLDGTRVIGTGTLNAAGVAIIPASLLALGTHPITAQYAATQNFAVATSAVLGQVVQSSTQMPTSTILAASVNPATSGQSITFTAMVATVGQSSSIPAGVVTFLDGKTVLATATLNSAGLAAFSTASLGVGSHPLSANYAGNAASAASSSTTLAEGVTSSTTEAQAPFTVTVSGTPAVDAGEAVNLLVTVAPRAGSVEPVQLSCANLPSESACTFGTATLPVNGGTTSLQISTMAPHDCGTTGDPYFRSAGLPFTGPALAGLLLLFIPRKRRKALAKLMMIFVTLCASAALTGCGNCTDLGTRPGDYTIRVVGTAAGSKANAVIAKIVLHVTVP